MKIVISTWVGLSCPLCPLPTFSTLSDTFTTLYSQSQPASQPTFVKLLILSWPTNPLSHLPSVPPWQRTTVWIIIKCISASDHQINFGKTNQKCWIFFPLMSLLAGGGYVWVIQSHRSSLGCNNRVTAQQLAGGVIDFVVTSRKFSYSSANRCYKCCKWDHCN